MLSLKQVQGVDSFLVHKTRYTASGVPITQLITGVMTFSANNAEDRSEEAPDTPGRFDSASEVAAVAVFGREGLNHESAGVGFWGGPTEPSAAIWWIPTNPLNQDYGRFILTQSRSAQGFGAEENSGVPTGHAGVEAYFLQLPVAYVVASPGFSPDNYIASGDALWPPEEHVSVKLFARPGAAAFGWDEPNLEPSIALIARDIAGSVSTETLLTCEKLPGVLDRTVEKETTVLVQDSASPVPIKTFYKDSVVNSVTLAGVGTGQVQLYINSSPTMGPFAVTLSMAAAEVLDAEELAVEAGDVLSVAFTEESPDVMFRNVCVTTNFI